MTGNDMKILKALIRRYGAVKVRTALIEARRRDAADDIGADAQQHNRRKTKDPESRSQLT